MIRYKKYQMTGENSPLKGLWYARPVIEETYDTERLAKHMANHNTPYSAGVVKGVLTDMISCIKELILDGKNVKLDDLAIFSVGIVSRKGAASAADFTLADNVKGLKLRARATGELSNAQINLEGQMKEAAVYNPDGGTTEAVAVIRAEVRTGTRERIRWGENNYKLLITNHYGRNEKIKIRMGHCPQSNHHCGNRYCGGLRFQFLQVAYAYRYTVCCSLLGHASGREPGL